MRQLVRLIVLLGCCVAVVPAQAACPQPKPRAGYEASIKTIDYIRSVSAQDLTEWQLGHSLMGNTVLGVGGGTIGTRLNARYEMREMPDGLFCVLPVEVKAEFYAAPQIHIASNFARGSCEYSEVLAHEQKHVAVLRQFHREYREGYNRHFRRVLQDLPAPEAVVLDDVEAAKKATTARIMEGLKPYVDAMMEELNTRQRAIDTPEEYRRVASKCRNWDKKLNAPERRSR